MLTASPIQNKEKQKQLCALCSIPFRPDCFSYSQAENGEVIALAQFDINENGGLIYDLQMKKGLEDDIEALFILGRAVLNFLDLSNIPECVYLPKDEHDVKMAKMLGFRENDGVYSLTIKNLFTKTCHDKK